MLRISINGRSQMCAPGLTVLAALRGAAMQIPTLCHDVRLTPTGGCRLCLVEIEGQVRPVTACTTLLADGMEIKTHTAQLEQLRRTQLRLLARRYPKAESGDSPSNDFLRLIRDYALEHDLGATSCTDSVDDSHSCIQVDISRCIHCFRCVRICEEVAGRFVWKAWNRGDCTEIRPASGVDLRNSDCVSCGACVDTCPSGALQDRSTQQGDLLTAEIRTVCPYCGAGCKMLVGRRDQKIVSVRPVLDAPVNKGHLCNKGRYGWDFVHAPDRISRPMISAASSGAIDPRHVGAFGHLIHASGSNSSTLYQVDKVIVFVDHGRRRTECSIICCVALSMPASSVR